MVNYNRLAFTLSSTLYQDTRPIKYLVNLKLQFIVYFKN